MSAALQELDLALKQTFVGPLSHLHDVITLGSCDRNALTIGDILRDDSLDAIVHAFCQTYGQTPRTSVLSSWSKWYFATVLPPLISANVVLDTYPPCELSGIRLVLNEDYMIERTVIAEGTPRTVATGISNRLTPFIEELIVPFITLFHRRTRVSHSVLWSNAGNLVEGVVRHLEMIGAPADAVRECDAHLNQPRLADGSRNRLYQPVVYIERSGERVRRRRVCCLRYMLPDGELCCACPRHENATTISSFLPTPEAPQ